MSTSDLPARGPGPPPGNAPGDGAAATRACRRAWWSLALYPLSFVGAFVVGEVLLSLLAEDTADLAFWQVLVAGGPALLLLIVPGLMAVTEGRRAVRLGRRDGKVPAVVGAVTAAAFVGVNLLSYLVGVVVD